MTLADFNEQSRKAVSYYGYATGTRLITQKLFERILARIGSQVNFGFRPLDHDWDALIVLDACRADLFEEFAPKHALYERFETVEARHSCATTSREWFSKGFGSAYTHELGSVHYVTQNPFVPHGEIDSFHRVERLWDVEGSDDAGRLDPGVVTDIALNAYRDTTAERFVVHYIPPHAPFMHCPDKYELPRKAWGGDTHDVWFGLQLGEFNREEVWADYGKNLLAILDEVQRLVEYVEGDIVITSDHGNGMGEFGIYGHPGYVPIPAIKRVPWVELIGGGKPINEQELEINLETSMSESAREDRLEALGYL